MNPANKSDGKHCYLTKQACQNITDNIRISQKSRTKLFAITHKY